MRGFALLAVALFPLTAAAHGMFAEAKQQQDGTMRAEVFYEDNEPAKQAAVQVIDSEDRVILKGTTDDDGVWTFPAPAPSRYRLRATHTGGHSATAEFTVRPRMGPLSPQTTQPGQVTQPTREEIVGPQRLLWVGGGVVVIGVAFGVLYFVVRKKKTPGEPAA